MKRLVLVLALAVLLMPALTFAGGGGQQGSSSSGTSGGSQEMAISLWFPMHASDIAEQFSDAYGSPGLAALRAATGVKINWTLSPAAGAAEQYNLMMASGDITDVVILDAPTLKLYTAAWLPIDTIIKANPSRYPNLTKYVLEDSYVSTYLKDNDGRIRLIPQIGSRRIGSVPMLRQDLLTAWGMKTPSTKDEWYAVLSRAKSAGMIPYATRSGRGGITALFEGYLGGILEEYYEDNGVIKYGVLQPRFREVIEIARQWYAEGLIDQEYPSNTATTPWTEKMLNGQAFATYDNAVRVADYNRQYLASTSNNSSFRLVGTLPMLNPNTGLTQTKGHYPKILTRCAAISAKAKNPERILDMYEYCLSGEGTPGWILMNFGIEGAGFSYDANGNPVMDANFQQKVADGTIKHPIVTKDMPKLVKDELYTNYNDDREDHASQRAVRDLYAQPGIIVENWIASLNFTDAERSTLTPIEAELDTYRSEMLDKFIMGIEPMSNWNAFVTRLQGMKLNQSIAVYQAALDRLLKN